MKKFLKVLLVIILIGLSVGGACLIFFYNYNKNKVKTFEYITNFLASSEFEEVETNISTIDGKLGGRFSNYISTKSNLDKIARTYSLYFANEDDYSIDHKPIIEKIKEVESGLQSADEMADEFLVKSSSEHFDIAVGANDLFNKTCEVLVFYSQALDEMAKQMDNMNLNKNADIKFAMIEAYLDVVEGTFSKTKKTGEILGLSSSQNLSLFNSVFKLENCILITNNTSNFSHLNNEFISCYNECDKPAFANNLSTNVASINTDDFVLGADQTLNATYYFKLIYEV